MYAIFDFITLYLSSFKHLIKFTSQRWAGAGILDLEEHSFQLLVQILTLVCQVLGCGILRRVESDPVIGEDGARHLVRGHAAPPGPGHGKLLQPPRGLGVVLDDDSGHVAEVEVGARQKHLSEPIVMPEEILLGVEENL